MLCAHGGLITALTGHLLELPITAWAKLGGIGNCHWTVLARRASSGLAWRLIGSTTPGSPAEPMPAPILLMFGDSLSFHGPDGPYPADDERLWPNLAAAALGGRTELFAGSGWTARDAFWALAGDPRVWAMLPKADVLVLAVGSMDTLPSPLPTYLREGLRYLRPDPLRRCVRTRYLAAQPWLARATPRAAGGAAART